MTLVAGVRFRNGGKLYYFSPGELQLKRGDDVIVETSKGQEYATVTFAPREIEDERITAPLKPILRAATEADKKKIEDNAEKEKKAYDICLEKIAKHKLEMKLISVEYSFDNSKILFYFTADGRVDFRELVKDLASVFRTRIELRQIGVRDETRILGGYGICGRPLCCHSYLSDFAPVSIKMAKEQNLSLNPTKISGSCGRLMCCLKNEQETYEYLNKLLPSKGDIVETPDKEIGEIFDVNILRQTVRVIVKENDEKELLEFPASDVVVKVSKKKKKNNNAANANGGKQKGPKGADDSGENLTPEELKALKLLEKE